MTDMWKLEDVPDDLVEVGAGQLWGDNYQSLGLPSYEEAKANPDNEAWGDLSTHVHDLQSITREILAAVLPAYRKLLVEELAAEWPTTTRDMVSRGHVRDWLLGKAE